MAAAAGVAAWATAWRKGDPRRVNDMHSLLNATEVAEVVRPRSYRELAGKVEEHARAGRALAISGSRHAMGGQQFATGETLIDMRGLNRVLDMDLERGVVHAEAGIEWPELLAFLHRAQRGREAVWTIPTKQGGADRLTLGGAIAANAHGRTLTCAPMGEGIESLTLIGPNGSPVRCDRDENPERFALAIGGYGLFGPVYSAKLRLVRRHKVRRVVSEVRRENVMAAFAERIAEGFTLGDWQFAIDERSDDFLDTGVFSCYRPVSDDTPIPHGQKKIPRRAWSELVYLAHTDKSRAYRLYRDYYLSSTGQVYWNDTSQMAGYLDGYHAALDRRMGARCPASEVITELYVPRDRFADFMADVAATIRSHGASVIYGTVRLIEKDETSFLRWAREPFACVIFNLHVEHSELGIEGAKRAFRALNDLALARGGTFFLTYHRWAAREQVEAGYPMLREFLERKRAYDPDERFQSDWYRHLKREFGMV